MSNFLHTRRDEKTGRSAVVSMSSPNSNVPFVTWFYDGVKLDHSRRFSRFGLATAAADEWCNDFRAIDDLRSALQS